VNGPPRTESMALGNVWANGIHSFDVLCRLCHQAMPNYGDRV
jgi:hypothetical protein